MQDNPAAALGNINDAEEVEAQVGQIVHRFAPGHDLARIGETFALLRGAFRGELAGYAELKTRYHDSEHTNEVVLCAARMLHGMHLAGRGLDADHIDAALIGALMHDFGYLMRDDEATNSSSTGAQFTAVHVARGVDFVRDQLPGLIDLPDTIRDATIKVIQLTDHGQHPDWVKFDNPQQQLAACATASADLVGQMANRQYLERLVFLYFEFREARIPGFGDIHDLMEKTTDFYSVTRTRIDRDLQGLVMYLRQHFAQAQGTERNFYMESIDRNLHYLNTLIHESRAKRLEKLKRGGIVEQALEQMREQNTKEEPGDGRA